MSPLRFHQQSQTAVELYIEKAQVQWYIKTLALCLVWMVGASFTIFPLAVNDAGPNGRSLPLGVFAVTLLFIGYAGSVILGLCVRVLMFQLDLIALPMIGSCAIGILSILFYTFARPGPVVFNGLTIAILITSSTLTIISSISAWILHRKIDAIGTHDRLRRQRGPAAELYTGQGSATSPGLPIDMLDEDELLRRQLVMLLQRGADQDRNQRKKQDGKKWWKVAFSSSSATHDALSMDDSSSYVDLLRSTYRIDLPGSNTEQASIPPSSIRTGSNPYLAVPHNASANSSLRASPQTSPLENSFMPSTTYRSDQYQNPTAYVSTVQTHYDPPPQPNHATSSSMIKTTNTWDRDNPPPTHHTMPTNLRNSSSTPNLHITHTSTHTYTPSTPPPTTEIHEAPPQKYQRNGWGRTSSPPPRPGEEEQRVKRPEPSPRELRRAEIELGMRRSGV